VLEVETLVVEITALKAAAIGGTVPVGEVIWVAELFVTVEKSSSRFKSEMPLQSVVMRVDKHSRSVANQSRIRHQRIMQS
jgi:hypothetical protein